MTPSMQDLGIHRLSIEQRIALAEEILESVDAENTPAPLTEAKRQELKRRIDALAASPNDVIPWEHVEAEALARFKK